MMTNKYSFKTETRDTKRLFIALPLPYAVRQQLRERVSQWQRWPFKKWVHVEDYHLTLKFLGDTTLTRLPRLNRSLAEIASCFSPFKLSLKNIGVFGEPSRPRILWIGVQGELDVLNNLQHKVEEEMAKLGYPADNRPYRPHVTLARTYRGKQTFDIRSLNQGVQLNSDKITWQVKEVVLYESRVDLLPMYKPQLIVQLGHKFGNYYSQ